MLAPLRHQWTLALCLLALTSLSSMSFAQNETTWHNDNNRTGWQQNETTLYATGTGHVSQSNFGLLWKWPVGRIRLCSAAGCHSPASCGILHEPV